MSGFESDSPVYEPYVPDTNSENTGHKIVHHAFFGRQVFMKRFRYFMLLEK